MKITDTKISDVKLIEPSVFEDERGFFFESFNHKIFEDAVGRKISFAQDNHSRSSRGVLRGLHYQSNPMAQGKLVRVVRGRVLDVAIDIRRESPTFGKWVGEILSDDNKKQLWIPEGFAHGFITISETADFLYKTTNYYSPSHEHCIDAKDPDININWISFDESVSIQHEDIILSEKDSEGKRLKNAELF